MWCCVNLALTDVSEESIASIFRVRKSASWEQASASSCRLSHQSETTSYKRTWTEGEYGTWEINRDERGRVSFEGQQAGSRGKMEAICSSETSVNARSTQLHIPEDGILHSHRCENLESYIKSYKLLEVTKENYEHMCQVVFTRLNSNCRTRSFETDCANGIASHSNNILS
jgi:hypothetical protein